MGVRIVLLSLGPPIAVGGVPAALEWTIVALRELDPPRFPVVGYATHEQFATMTVSHIVQSAFSAGGRPGSQALALVPRTFFSISAIFCRVTWVGRRC